MTAEERDAQIAVNEQELCRNSEELAELLAERQVLEAITPEDVSDEA